ncbi:MAG: hypothetical protein AMJ93_15035 [Anaerolineae bacterium SM23_84]|nr:MAG: hypothetical protein AMJ93_15035 [Anaerolineae bacterium SM23_84]
MKRIDIPAKNWPTELAKAITEADEKTVIVVRTEAMRELGLNAARRLGKSVVIAIEGGKG